MSSANRRNPHLTLVSSSPQPRSAPPQGLELAWKNRQILSDRLDWPRGMLAICERVERDFPDWSIVWSDAWYWSGSRTRVGFYAEFRKTIFGVTVPKVFGATEKALRGALAKQAAAITRRKADRDRTIAFIRAAMR
ncbi:hypothetical protein [Dactylosporangium sp. CS-033363]|uniref:hypothetical protein n=1 Tax=Dactylosporangium sp. CS-033363 TaxID=3239935 RepID=UPI003D8C655A